MKSKLVAVVLCLVAVIAVGATVGSAPRTPTLMPPSAQKWAPLDPKAPGNGELSLVFGDLSKKAPVGFLLRFSGGLKEPFHLHTSDYYAVEVTGVQHDWAEGTDEGPALPAGSWWMQPGNAAHANHCEPGQTCVVFVYMPNGFDFTLAK
jgi:Domain of unknown function (DUF4437)